MACRPLKQCCRAHATSWRCACVAHGKAAQSSPASHRRSKRHPVCLRRSSAQQKSQPLATNCRRRAAPSAHGGGTALIIQPAGWWRSNSTAAGRKPCRASSQERRKGRAPSRRRCRASLPVSARAAWARRAGWPSGSCTRPRFSVWRAAAALVNRNRWRQRKEQVAAGGGRQRESSACRGARIVPIGDSLFKIGKDRQICKR